MPEDVQYELGDKVEFDHVLTRMIDPERLDAGRSDRKVWRVEERNDFSGVGIIIGKRTYANGMSQFESDYDDWSGKNYGSWIFIADSYQAVYLISWDLQRKPVAVLPEHLRRVSE